jgi:hypothetical protein
VAAAVDEAVAEAKLGDEPMIAIPDDHWGDRATRERVVGFIPIWEKALRARIDATPDPATRFGVWLETCASGGYDVNPRLWFIEQPYLAWAEVVRRVVAKVEQDLRERIADDIRNPSEN